MKGNSEAMDNTILYNKLAKLPDKLKGEVLDFIDFLVKKHKKSEQRKKPTFGSGRGMFVMKPDFDEPLDDFKEYIR